MAGIAKQDMEKRVVEVNRKQLIETLRENKYKHVKKYLEAVAGYKSVLLNKITESYAEALKGLDVKYNNLKSKVEALKDEDVPNQRDNLVLIDAFVIEMQVPCSYEAEYDAAIDMAKWDVNNTLKLTHAEFNCFVRDKWDWKSSFENSTIMYLSK